MKSAVRYKVCTIGDAYLAVNEPKTQHDDQIMGALVLLHLAMAMLRIIVQVRDEVDHQGESSAFRADNSKCEHEKKRKTKDNKGNNGK